MDKNVQENIGEKSLFQSYSSIIKIDNSPDEISVDKSVGRDEGGGAALGSRLSSYYLL